jgi:hypothetical protein
MRMLMLAAAVLLMAGTAAQAARAGGLPRRLGQCAVTRIKFIGTRLEDGITHEAIPDSGSAVDFTNGGHQVSYDTLPAVTGSRVGDTVRMCLISIPRHCPPGDDRGRKYRTTNLRTHGSWRLLDSEHVCGGA